MHVGGLLCIYMSHDVHMWCSLRIRANLSTKVKIPSLNEIELSSVVVSPRGRLSLVCLLCSASVSILYSNMLIDVRSTAVKK